ncbi:hypothetical protein NPIRD3C_0570 [Nitrosopumilus piranensis]|uniref:Uncharacterized protein n=1 Tax=Nitrosopumilus piranensis TaxID=1582439 RepID=A0A0C5BUB1_9ARCH|nr:hypothetical protein NPIRD3C_0570 [Nitrosopumilus piranensis]
MLTFVRSIKNGIEQFMNLLTKTFDYEAGLGSDSIAIVWTFWNTRIIFTRM